MGGQPLGKTGPLRWLEVRRHSFTKKGEGRDRGSHLSEEGVQAARRVGSGMGPFAYVVASTAPRTAETALAMGFAVDEIVEMGSGYVGGVAHHDQWTWKAPYLRYRTLLDTEGPLTVAAAAELDRWRYVLARVPDRGAALLIGHGGTIEPTLVTALPHADYVAWGAPFSHLDGARLAFEEDRFISIDFERHGS